jgi:hypothetical protein
MSRSAVGSASVVVLVFSTSLACRGEHPDWSQASSAVTLPVNVTNAMYKIQKTNPDPYFTFPGGAASIAAAKNEFEAFQIVIPGTANHVNATAGDLSCTTGACAGQTIIGARCGVGQPRGNVRLYRERYYGTNITSANWSDTHSMLGTLPDALIPQVDEFYDECRNFSFDVAAGQNGVIWVDVYVPSTQAAGTYTGNITITSDQGQATVPVTLEVWDFTLPSTASLRTTFNGGGDSIRVQHGAGAICDANVAKLHRLYAAMGLDHRITINELDDFCNVSASYVASTYGALFDGQMSTKPEITRLPQAKTTSIQYMQSNTNGTTLASWASTMSAHTGWFEQLFQYTCDEPPATCAWSDIALRAQAAHGANASFRTLVTTDLDEAAAAGVNYNRDINLFVEVIDHLEGTSGNERWEYTDYPQGSGQNWQAQHSYNQLWTYQSCDSHGCGSAGTDRWPSYMIDARPMRNRALEWFSFKNRLSGELYFATTQTWDGGEWDDQWAFSGHGDGTLLYPGTPSAVSGGSPVAIGGTNHIPIASIRLKLIREGMEDYEYLKLLADQGSTAFADAKVAAVFPNGAVNTESDPEVLYAKRREMACQILTNLGKSCSGSGGGSHTLTVAKAGSGSGTVTSSPAGINCGATCSASFASGTVVLTASASAGSTFSGWTGDCTGTGTCTVDMAVDHAVTATFATSGGTCGVDDCFDRADGALGASWNAVQPSIQIVGNAAQATDVGTKQAIFSESVGPDQDVSVLCKTTAASGSNCGLTARYNDVDNLYYTYIDVGLGHVDLWRRSGGAVTLLGSATRTISADTFYPLRLVVSGSSLQVYFNNEATPTVSATDSVITTGSTGGLHAYANTANSVIWNDFNIAPAPGGALFFDDFNRTSGLGGNWNVTSGGSFTTDGANAVSGANPENWARVVPSVGTNDYVVSADMVVPTGSLFSGIVARTTTVNTDQTLYAAQIATDGHVNLYRRNDWVWTQLGSAAVTITAGTQYHLALAVSGSSTVHLEVTLDGVQRITYDDSSASRVTTGAPAIQNYNGSVRYNTFRVDPAAAPPLFFDDFTRTTGLGASWNVTSGGSFTTDGANAVSGANPENWARVVPALGTNDYAVSALLTVPSGSLFSGIVARTATVNTDQTLYAAQLATDGHVNLYRRNDWTWTLLATAATTITANVPYTAKLVVSGSNPVHLEVWLDGTKKLNYDDSSASRVTSGVPGMQNYNGSVKYGWFRVD